MIPFLRISTRRSGMFIFCDFVKLFFFLKELSKLIFCIFMFFFFIPHNQFPIF